MEQLEEMARASGPPLRDADGQRLPTPAQGKFYAGQGYWTLGSLPDAAKKGITELVLVKEV